ncbi:hypothetical protein, partial [Rhizobium sp. GR12]|uniref:hypothetical protein n=1 Tax=Rhizobium sp. GR12 TaxID=3053925 RepID=UPI002FBD5B5C
KLGTARIRARLPLKRPSRRIENRAYIEPISAVDLDVQRLDGIGLLFEQVRTVCNNRTCRTDAYLNAIARDIKASLKQVRRAGQSAAWTTFIIHLTLPKQLMRQ